MTLLQRLHPAMFVLIACWSPLIASDDSPQPEREPILLNRKQLFIDDFIIEETRGLTKVLNQPVKHPDNPLAAPDLPWEKHGFYANGTVIYDEQDGLFKAWVHMWKHEGEELAATVGLCAYLTSRDGIHWQKPVINAAGESNRILPPTGTRGFCGHGIMKDPNEHDPGRRYKMIYTRKAGGNSGDYQTCAAYSADGIVWKAEPANPVIPFGDTQNAPLWDPARRSYLAFVRTGPPNVRGIARIESRDFVHWSPKVTVFRPGTERIDLPFRTNLYGMKVMSYAGCFIGLINAYHGETLGPIPKDKQWMDKVNVQLAWSRNGITWSRVDENGAIPQADLDKDLDWERIARNQIFLPYGEHKKEWDWGQIYAYHSPVVFKDRIWIYYTGLGSRHWSNYHGDDRPPKSGIGLATLRLDGFVSVQPRARQKFGTLTTRPFFFFGNEIEINADASGGSIRVEALNQDGSKIDGFSARDCIPLRSDDLRHRVRWQGDKDSNQLQGRPICLRFHLDRAKLYSFAPTKR